jgi:hypothetical protein
VGSGDEPNPTYTYLVPGDFDVSLRVDGPCASATLTRTVTVHDGMQCVYLPLIRKEEAGR